MKYPITLSHPGLAGGLVITDEGTVVELQQRGLIEGNETIGYKITRLGFDYWNELRIAKMRAQEKIQ